jgi:hypothetical protein
MASAASVATGWPATTFNAAGLNANTVAGYSQADPNLVNAYYSPTDPLSRVQDNRGTVLTGAVGAVSGLLGPEAGGSFAGWILGNEAGGTPVAPTAFGVRRPLPYSPPPGKNLLNAVNPLDGHGMDWITSGISSEKKANGCP